MEAGIQETSNSSSWRNLAACADPDVDPDTFFNNGRGNKVAQWKKAQRICDRCAVKIQCLAVAIRRPERHGMWGGKRPSERKSIIAERNTERGTQ
ncbi:WhiB family transcriptional regulator [Streptomyces djakartensis]|uniref:WhiB family transcriptional regulator n=1 Tax=Streptomyces djakartensis TaxID=68193 RepID=UPI0034DDFBFB